MNIGINALFNPNGGSFVNLLQLLLDWDACNVLDKHKIVIFASESTSNKLRGLISDKYDIVLFEHCSGVISRTFYEQTILPSRMKKYNLSVLFCPGNTVPLTTSIPCVATFQNAAPFCNNIDISATGIRRTIQFIVLGLFIRLSARKAYHIIFVSNYFYNLFIDLFNFEKSHGTVIYRAKPDKSHYTAQCEIRDKYRIDGEYIFTVSHLIPYKNIRELILGYALANKSYPGAIPKLYIAGGEYVRGYRRQMQSLIDELSLASNIVLLGTIHHDDVTSLLQSCRLFIFTSTCENCPTALIEAMVEKLPIACSNVGVMPEIAGDAAFYFNPYKPEEIAEALFAMCNDNALRSEVQSKMDKELARLPGRSLVASQTMEILESAAG